MTASDRTKMTSLTASLRQLARSFGFSTFPTDEITLDEDSYRPQKEGYEIGFETSASDAIRLKWAYQLGLLELSQDHSTNHPGMLLLDEVHLRDRGSGSRRNRETYPDRRGTWRSRGQNCAADVDLGPNTPSPCWRVGSRMPF
jgi:hypothetical protein